MTKKQRRDEIISNLTNTLELESLKPNGGNIPLVEKLTAKLETIKSGTFVSKMRKRRV
tara:strand:- start:423 stop:596 length:174 start_codon:yes stop_codon:yes gene_type:complete